MTQRLVLDVPETMFQILANTAAQAGCPVEKVALDWLARGSVHASPDPLTTIVGLIDSGAPGWSDHHDEYFGGSPNDAT